MCTGSMLFDDVHTPASMHAFWASRISLALIKPSDTFSTPATDEIGVILKGIRIAAPARGNLDGACDITRENSKQKVAQARQDVQEIYVRE